MQKYTLKSSPNDRIFDVPFDYNSTVYYVNKDMLGSAGVAPPDDTWTVDDLRDIARKISDVEQNKFGTNNPFDLDPGYHMQWLKNWTGHKWLSETFDQVLVDNPDAAQLYQWWYENVYHYEITPRPGTSWASSSRSRAGLESGRFGLYLSWLSYANHLPDPPIFDWKLILYPKAPAGQGNFAQSHMFSITSASTKKDAAWRFIEWMASYEGQIAVVEHLRRAPISPYQDLWDLFFHQVPSGKHTEVSRWVLSTLYGAGFADNLSYWTTFPDMNTVMLEHTRNIFVDHKPIRSELNEAARRLEQLLPQR